MNLSKLFINLQIFFWLRSLNQNIPYEQRSIEYTQNNKLKNLIKKAYSIPFYKKRFDDAGVDPNKINNVEDLKLLPILTKDEYRSWIHSEYEHAPDRYQKWFRDGTSGSTGLPITIYRPWSEQAYIIAKWLREMIMNGYRPLFDSVFAIVSPHRIHGKDSLIQKLGLFKRYTVSYLSKTSSILEQYNHIKPDIFYANKSQMIQMAEYANKNEIKLWKPRVYFCGAETIDAASRQIIYNSFGRNNFIETYGCVELGILAFQLRGCGDFLHFSHDTNILEIQYEKLNQNMCGRALITDLHQYAFPLIRYDIGDYIELKLHKGVQVISRVLGRADDWLIFEDGDKIPFHFFYEIMERRSEVRQFRIIQENFDLIRVMVAKVPDTDETKLKQSLLKDLRRTVRDEGVTYEIEWVDEIPPDPNGKLRMLISKIKQSE